jgi:hypothetical protein
MRGACCVVPTRGPARLQGSDRDGEFVEGDHHSPGHWLLDGQLVGSSPEVLDQGMPDDDHPGAGVLLEPSHRPQARLQPAVIRLDPVVGVPVGSMPCRWEQFVQHDRVCRCSVGDNLHRGHLRCGDGPFEDPAGRGDITPRGDEHVNDLVELIDRPGHIPPSPSDLPLGLVHEPASSYSVPAGAGGLCQQRREPPHPSVDGDVVDLDPGFSQQLLNVAGRQPEAQVPAGREDDDV